MSGASSRLGWQHPSLALVAPVLLLALGVWQITRVAGATDDFAARAARVQATEDRLRPIAAKDPASTIRFENNPRTYTAAEALARLDEAHTDLQREALIEQARSVAAWTAAVCGAIGALCTLAGLLSVALCARRGMRSRPALVGAFGVMVRLLPLILGGVAVGTALAFVGAVLFEADRAALDVGHGRAAGTALIRTGIAAVLVGGPLEDVWTHLAVRQTTSSPPSWPMRPPPASATRNATSRTASPTRRTAPPHAPAHRSLGRHHRRHVPRRGQPPPAARGRRPHAIPLHRLARPAPAPRCRIRGSRHRP